MSPDEDTSKTLQRNTIESNLFEAHSGLRLRHRTANTAAQFRWHLRLSDQSLVNGHCHVVERGELGECGVTTPMLSYKGHRYPAEIINHCVWLYFRFPLSFREVEELMLERGVVVSYETIRRWCVKFG